MKFPEELFYTKTHEWASRAANRVRVPIQLQADDQPIASRRKGGGTGAPGQQVASATPQQSREDAQLAPRPAPEGAADRAAIPPDYRPVFERVSQPEATKESK